MYVKINFTKSEALKTCLKPFLKENESNIDIISIDKVSDRTVVKYTFNRENDLIERSIDMDSKEFKKYRKALESNNDTKIEKALFLIDILEENSLDISSAA